MANNTNKCQCSVNNCKREVAARGYCLKHYKQWRKHGRVTEDCINEFNLVVDKERYYEVILTDNKLNEVVRAKIDKEDLNKIRAIGRWGLDGNGYVKNTKSGNYIHRIIMDAENHELVDHRKVGTKYKRDNRKKNLRLCTESDNNCNTNIRKDNTSGSKGVDYHEKRGQRRARVTYNGVCKNVGWFKTKESAITARSKAAKDMHKKFYNEGSNLSIQI